MTRSTSHVRRALVLAAASLAATTVASAGEESIGEKLIRDGWHQFYTTGGSFSKKAFYIDVGWFEWVNGKQVRLMEHEYKRVVDIEVPVVGKVWLEPSPGVAVRTQGYYPTMIEGAEPDKTYPVTVTRASEDPVAWTLTCYILPLDKAAWDEHQRELDAIRQRERLEAEQRRAQRASQSQKRPEAPPPQLDERITPGAGAWPVAEANKKKDAAALQKEREAQRWVDRAMKTLKLPADVLAKLAGTSVPQTQMQIIRDYCQGNRSRFRSRHCCPACGPISGARPGPDSRPRARSTLDNTAPPDGPLRRGRSGGAISRHGTEGCRAACWRAPRGRAPRTRRIGRPARCARP